MPFSLRVTSLRSKAWQRSLREVGGVRRSEAHYSTGSEIMRIVLLPFVLAIACGGTSNPDRCDAAEQSISCSNMASLSQCLDFAGLSTKDYDYWLKSCTASSGSIVSDCPTANRLGTCILPPKDSVTCSPNASVSMRLFAPRYTAAEAKVICDDIPFATWVPG